MTNNSDALVLCWLLIDGAESVVVVLVCESDMASDTELAFSRNEWYEIRDEIQRDRYLYDDDFDDDDDFCEYALRRIAHAEQYLADTMPYVSIEAGKKFAAGCGPEALPLTGLDWYHLLTPEAPRRGTEEQLDLFSVDTEPSLS